MPKKGVPKDRIPGDSRHPVVGPVTKKVLKNGGLLPEVTKNLIDTSLATLKLFRLVIVPKHVDQLLQML
jgi:hypothetical protein